MRITYRSREIKEYWARRWDDISVDGPMRNTHIYPLKYALMAIPDSEGHILEAGCGAGRILRYFHENGYDIVGIDYIGSVIQKLKREDPSLDVNVGDISNLEYPDGHFKYVLAFGLYHNLEHTLAQAVNETYRVLEQDGVLCASFRADNIQTRLTDWLADKRSRTEGRAHAAKEFHKINLKKDELSRLFTDAGFLVDRIFSVENMPFLYKFAFFRYKSHRVFDENVARSEGYRLSFTGRLLQTFLMRVMPSQFCNIYVVFARKP